MNLKNLIYEKFLNGEFEYKGAKRIFELLGAKSNFEKDSVRSILNSLEDDAKIVYEDGKYLLIEHSNLIKGELKGNERGFAFFIPQDKSVGDFFIPSSKLHGAMHKDIVLIKKAVSKRGSTDEGEVVKILNRGVTKLVGTFQKEENFGFVIADDKNYFCDVYIPFKKSRGAKNGDKVVCEITKYPDGNKRPEGVILEILGKKHDFKTEELSIIKNHGYELEFPKKVEKELEQILDYVTEQDCQGRKDFTDIFTVTIDGEDSRDFDDAISLTKTDDGFTLMVHIADVSHYVKPFTNIDKEALTRSTSVYFPERVIPMLPKKLSNGICSLNENQKRLCLSVCMDIDLKGNVTNYEIVESVISSNKRLTYTEVQKMIDNHKETIALNRHIYPFIMDAYDLMKILDKKRMNKGNINLDVKESHITVDENKKIHISARESKQAYKIIEEFMILANETVSEYVYYLNLPFIYRIHKKPEMDKFENFKNFLKILGINVKWNYENCHSKDFQILLEKLRGEKLFSVVNKVMLRSMQKAEYYPENFGHFGLSSDCYCHFTSPIRRYPDLIVHRVLKSIINNDFETLELLKGQVYEISNISSMNERKADLAEREMDDYYKCRYMKDKIGEVYTGVISGVTSFGIFVELENTVEGIIRLESLPRGEYSFDETSYTLSCNKFKYTLGDSVEIIVAGVDFASKKIDFELL